ncbi:hypothetical protein Sulku_0418 [Sulfuricurvum kujiense DSM 16994]|uniref:Cytochrome c domain-containing protein n=1 Tax=Sulfuricurvum kujiense (strain ATCC BAA-921 / DSM 16994 / JCM 11577 / YK-1) TaxID=709032 RepID=E4TZJ7_SULKY|nr:hypothetical protein [Sulfuricurvum kujiense]ADR33085.1 hypothetical protein Sulku_0418 [Sulfuricurvum kujiense DSM 16994]
MKRIGISVLILIAQLHANEPQSYTPGLGDMMGAVQIRHAKLWFAGQNQNWKLATYELDEIKEGLEDAAVYHPIFKGKPIAKMMKISIAPALDQVEESIKQKNSSQFIKAFETLSNACTSCHKNSGYGFIVIERPSTPPFSNQRFKP